MRLKKITTFSLALSALSASALASDDVVVDLSVLNNLGTSYYQESAPLFPVWPSPKQQIAKPEIVKQEKISHQAVKTEQQAKVQERKAEIKNTVKEVPNKKIEINKQEEVVVVDVEPVAPEIPDTKETKATKPIVNQTNTINPSKKESKPAVTVKAESVAKVKDEIPVKVKSKTEVKTENKPIAIIKNEPIAKVKDEAPVEIKNKPAVKTEAKPIAIIKNEPVIKVKNEPLKQKLAEVSETNEPAKLQAETVKALNESANLLLNNDAVEATKAIEAENLAKETLKASLDEDDKIEVISKKETPANALLFGDGESELSDELQSKVDNIIKTFKNDKNSKIAIYSYNFDDGVDSFYKKRTTLNRAIEIRSYLLRKGFKNFSIKVVNISKETDKANMVEIEEI